LDFQLLDALTHVTYNKRYIQSCGIVTYTITLHSLPCYMRCNSVDKTAILGYVMKAVQETRRFLML